MYIKIVTNVILQKKEQKMPTELNLRELKAYLKETKANSEGARKSSELALDSITTGILGIKKAILKASKDDKQKLKTLLKQTMLLQKGIKKQAAQTAKDFKKTLSKIEKDIKSYQGGK